MSKKKALAPADLPPPQPDPAVTQPELAWPARSGPTVGQQLRTAREAAGLDIAEIARTLKFSVRQIELLEADDYAALPGNTIVRGFVRSYARLLKLDAEPLLHLLDERTPSVAADVRPPDNMGTAKQPWESRQMPVLATILLGLFIVAAVASGLWHFYGPTLMKSVDLVVPAPPPPAAVSIPVDAPQLVPPRDAGGAPAGGADAAAVPVAPAEILPPRLTFVFEDRSWIEVTDATRKVIHSGEHQAGTQLNLDGRPPFELVIGNPARVRLTYGDRSIDLAPHTRADVARLKVE